jgi:hypothetical protein
LTGQSDAARCIYGSAEPRGVDKSELHCGASCWREFLVDL